MGSIDTYARLSRPRGLNDEKIVSFLHSGLPINSLPGWELIPLNAKLPMLKCPGNQVIFSTHKIGEHIKRPKQDFNPITSEKLPEYRSLEDDHLRDFFLRTEILKRLRANGEITENNDVICTLKDFNQFRRELDRSKRSLDLQMSMEKAIDAYDQRLMDYAYKVTDQDTYNDDYFGMKVRQRRDELMRKRQENFERSWQHTMERIQKIEQKRLAKKAAWIEKKTLNNLNIKHHYEVMVDLSRRKIIKSKMQAKRKEIRSQNVLMSEEKRRKQERYDRLWVSWQKRLAERINSGQYMHNLLEKAKKQREVRIVKFNERIHAIWLAFHNQHSKLSRRNRLASIRQFGMKHSSKKRENRYKEKLQKYDKFEAFNELLDDELYIMLSNVVDSEEFNIPFDDDDPLYKAAQFIKNYVLTNFNMDLSEDQDLSCALKKQLSCFIAGLKYNTFLDGQRILFSLNTLPNTLNLRCLKNSHSKKEYFKVNFKEDYDLISGEGYELHPNVQLRSVVNRTPTPKSSLASIIVEAESTLKWGISLSMKRMSIVFVEYAYAKFKRQVLVGVQSRVLSALQLHAQGKLVSLRQQLLDINEYYLIDKAAKAILSSAVDKINFNACVFLCINVMSSKIICLLQKVMAAYREKQENGTNDEMVTDTWLMQQQYILPEYQTQFQCN